MIKNIGFVKVKILKDGKFQEIAKKWELQDCVITEKTK